MASFNGALTFAALAAALRFRWKTAYPPSSVRLVVPFRVRRPGSSLGCLGPFMLPYRPLPRAYFNMSRAGLEFPFRRFSRCTVETNMGPTPAMVNLVSEYAGIALSENNRVLYSIG